MGLVHGGDCIAGSDKVGWGDEWQTQSGFVDLVLGKRMDEKALGEGARLEMRGLEAWFGRVSTRRRRRRKGGRVDGRIEVEVVCERRV